MIVIVPRIVNENKKECYRNVDYRNVGCDNNASYNGQYVVYLFLIRSIMFLSDAGT